MSFGKVFQTRGPATVKTRLPTVMSDDRADRQQERVDPITTEHFREELCMSERRLCTQSALGRAASEDWQARR